MPSKQKILKYKWSFTTKFRKNSYPWDGTQLASKRLKEALNEIKKVVKSDSELAAVGAITLYEKIVPAIEHIDSSSGAIGTAVFNTLQTLFEIIGATQTTLTTREEWLQRIWEAYQEDGYGYLDCTGESWGRLCGRSDYSKELALKWANNMLECSEVIRKNSIGRTSSYFKGDDICLSCFLEAGEFEQVLSLVERTPYKSWHTRKFAAMAHRKMGDFEKAIAYAEASRGPYSPDRVVDKFCEEVLIEQGLKQEAYRRYGLSANEQSTKLNTFRSLVKKYPEMGAERILGDLIESNPSEKGKWFATAKSLGFLKLALDLIQDSPCDPGTLNRAARDFLEENPLFSYQVAQASLKWMSEGYGYELTNFDVYEARNLLLESAKRVNQEEEARCFLRSIADNTSTEAFVRKYLKT